MELRVREALLAEVFVPAYPPALRLSPLEFTVHVTLVAAVLRPTANAERPIVLPLELRLMLLPAAKLDVAGAEITIWELFVPDRVTLTPDRLIVEPEAVVFPDVAPVKTKLAAPPAAAVRYAGTPRFSPFVSSVPTIAVPVVVVELNPVRAILPDACV